MEFSGGFKAEEQNKMKHLHGERMGLDSETYLVIQLPHPIVFRIISRSVFLGLVILTLPCIGSILRGLSVSELELDSASKAFDFEQLALVFNDFSSEGLRKKDDKALLVSPGNVGTIQNLHPFDYNGFDYVLGSDSDSDSEQKGSFLDESLDFVFTLNLVDAKFVDRILKIGGVVAVPISNDPSNSFRPQPNYKIVYLRRYATTFVAMRKTGPTYDLPEKPRQLCQFETQAKKAALKGLETVLLEPPRRLLGNSNDYLKKINFLPDLLGDDSLEGYGRRVFVNVDLNEENEQREENRGAIEWFDQNYPKKEKEFEVYNLEVVPEEGENTMAPAENDVSDWLKRNVKEEDYVVMKAEAEVVVEMMKKKAICLVDELFLECNNTWWENGKESEKKKRAYWECIALYGRVRDLGVAVHQWLQ